MRSPNETRANERGAASHTGDSASFTLEPGQRKSLAFHAALSQNQLTHAGGISLAAGSLHDLTDDSASSLNLTGTDLVGDVGHCCQCFLNGCGECAVVGDHGEAARLNDFGGGAFTGEDDRRPSYAERA